MSFYSQAGSTLSPLIGVSTEGVDGTRADLNAALGSGALQNAANYGDRGQALQNAADGLMGQNVGLDYSKVAADQAKLDALTQHYLSQYANGGLAAQAAIQAAQAQRGLNAQGGMAGIRADTLRSADAQQQVGQVAQSEINQAGAAVNQLDTQKARIALQRAVMAAQVSHANFEKNQAANALNFQLTNSQQQLQNQMQAELNNVRNQGTQTNINLQDIQGVQGQQLLDMLVAAGSGLAATTASQAKAGAAAQTGSGAIAPIDSAVNIQPTDVGAGYIQPAATMGRSDFVNQPYTPIFNTPPALPNTASYFNRGA